MIKLMTKKKLASLVVAPTVALVLGAALPACSPMDTSEAKPAAAAKDMAVKSASEKANEMYDRMFEEWVATSPEWQSYLGRKTNGDKWDDLSEAHAEKSLALNKRQLRELKAINVDLLDAPTALSYALLTQSIENDIADHKWHLYNYPVNQMFGVHSGVPSLLINQHRIADVNDANNYIGRLNNIPLLFDQLIDGLQRRADAGIVPPKFVFPHAIRDSKNLIKGSPFDDGKDNALIADFKKKLATLADAEGSELTSDKQKALIAQAEKSLVTSVGPAYEKLTVYLQELEKTANTDDGVWKWKDGAQYYDIALARTTTTDLTADEIHNIGLSEVERIHDEMRVIRDTVGFKGDLSEFMQFMRTSKQFLYEANEEGRAKYLSEATALIENMKGRLDELFITKPKADINVKAVEAFREESAGKAFYQQPSEDGTRPGLYYANLYDMESMPTYQMEALAYHEGIPGHHMQIAIQQELTGIPKFRKYGRYTAYSEGWGLYSEQVPKEIGLYADPYSDFGRLAMELWRACRLVVDTGIHSKKWTREQGIDYYVTNTPNAKLDAVKMVERHIVMPSQATAYKIGMLKILELREAAKEKLGDRFDIRQFHDEVLKYGALPLNILQRKVEAWSDRVLATAK